MLFSQIVSFSLVALTFSLSSIAKELTPDPLAIVLNLQMEINSITPQLSENFSQFIIVYGCRILIFFFREYNHEYPR